jgi:hypothetical protein
MSFAAKQLEKAKIIISTFDNINKSLLNLTNFPLMGKEKREDKIMS